MSSEILAVVLAAVAATCFAAAAVAQHDALSGVADPRRRLSLAAVVSLVRRPRWVTGVLLAAGGVALHAGALALAPLSVVQPVGVVAVPIAVAAVFVRARSRPSRAVVLGSALTVTGVVAFVASAGPTSAAAPRPDGVLVLAAAAVAVVVAALAALGLSRTGAGRSLGCAAAAAVSFGLVSVLLRTLLSQLGSGLGAEDPAALTLLGGMAASVAVGGWLAQQALASGAAAVSLSVLTVLDPVVAVALGAVIGDGSPATWALPLVAVVPAIAGVVVLARHHPAGGAVAVDRPRGARPAPRPATALDLRDLRHEGAGGTRTVLVGVDTYPPDVNGAARFAENLARGLAERGHEVHVVAPSTTGAPATERTGQVTVHRLRSHAWPGRPQLRVCLPWQVRRQTAALLERIGPDVVHVQSHFPVGRALLDGARGRGVPVVATNHVVPDNFLARVPRPLRRATAALFWADLARVLVRASVVTAPTPRAVAMLERAGVPGAVPVSNGTDLAVARRGAGGHDGADRDRSGPTVLFVGRLDREKHVEDLVRAVAVLGPDAAPLVEVVGNGPCRGAWSALARDLGVASRVRFLGYVSDEQAAAARRRAAVFVMPGTAELQSLATLEAMAAGLPVVAADAMALPHLVRPGANGWLYRPGDVADLAGRLADLLADPVARARMGRESRTIALGHDVSRTLDTFEGLYDEAAGRAADRSACAASSATISARAEASQPKRPARARQAIERSRHAPGSPRARTALAKPAASPGRTYRAASPHTSWKTAMSLTTTGVPTLMASTRGMPKPSSREALSSAVAEPSTERYVSSEAPSWKTSRPPAASTTRRSRSAGDARLIRCSSWSGRSAMARARVPTSL